MYDWLTQGLIDRGMDPRLAVAFGWNGQDESGLRTDINEAAPIVPGSRGGYGVMQWTGPRRRALEAFAADRGASVADPNVQLDFLMYELSGPETSAWSKIQGAGGTPEAAAAIVNYFLRPAEQHRQRREADYLGGNSDYSPSGNALAYAPLPTAQNALGMMPQQPDPPRMVANLLDPAAFMRSPARQFIPI